MHYWDIQKLADFDKVAGEHAPRTVTSGGIRTISLENWRLLEPLLYTMVEMSHAIYRGVQRHDYKLEPSIFRRFESTRRDSLRKQNEYITRCYDHFKAAIRGRRGPSSKPLEAYNTYELWSLGRHFGVKNTLLDWTRSPYIGLFFAFVNWHEDGTRSLYCLKQHIIEEADQTLSRTPETYDITLTKDPEYHSLRFYTPLSDENFRMINQQGLFTVSRSHHTIQQWVAKNYDEVKRSLEDRKSREKEPARIDQLQEEIESGWILLKIDIETDTGTRGDETRKQILKWLNRMNINHATLFPDIEGASLYANLQGAIKHY